ncbi:MFS transporter [Natrinema sp. 1APR25-10V2]|uniref:MFS transporter n=1 Tax=Natrinema sp. 1APR25-10V2 TaxID=2951081 RepID=UPI002876DD03|nr:MFS transporter [Natrinema sp. 1APR25-10V2]MDS0477219.1 MFS transporter [Natrinema sp. 1APR25-10V2]
MGATENSTTAEPSVGVPWRSPVLIAVLAATLMTPMDVPLISSALPEIQSVFGVSESRAGLFITLYALPGILLAPLIGALADRIGRRYVLSGALAVFGVAGTAIAFTDDFAVALGLRVLQGFAAGSILSALAMTVVGDRYTGRQHDAVMGVTSAVLSLGTAVYPVVGGYLAARAWNAPFFMYACTIPVAGLVLFALDEPASSADGGEHGYIREAIRLIPTRRAFVLYGVMFASFTLLFGGLYTALPFYLSETFGFTPAAVGLVTSIVLLVTAAVSTQNGRLAARASTKTLLTAGFALYAIGFLGIGLANATPLLVGALLVFGVGSGLVTPTLFAEISALAPDRVRGGVMSLQTTTIGISQTVGPALFTLFGGVIGYQGTLLTGSVGATLGVAVLGVVTLGS